MEDGHYPLIFMALLSLSSCIRTSAHDFPLLPCTLRLTNQSPSHPPPPSPMQPINVDTGHLQAKISRRAQDDTTWALSCPILSCWRASAHFLNPPPSNPAPQRRCYKLVLMSSSPSLLACVSVVVGGRWGKGQLKHSRRTEYHCLDLDLDWR